MKCTWCAAGVPNGPWLPVEESSPYNLGTGSRERCDSDAHVRSREHLELPRNLAKPPPKLLEPQKESQVPIATLGIQSDASPTNSVPARMVRTGHQFSYVDEEIVQAIAVGTLH
uniref:Uncharacterized protein n=1 Tax=Eutreptiella gymnastica TaxID=73025 RepID=A0A7S1NAQ4_9EUGL|mmetsp:Transcript_147259/g.257249  ORF Transcript_147259/g.257249 Transcript_147259/m.257249 type:complete len:114 (+) Transcript_147259:190-531(+)